MKVEHLVKEPETLGRSLTLKSERRSKTPRQINSEEEYWNLKKQAVERLQIVEDKNQGVLPP